MAIEDIPKSTELIMLKASKDRIIVKIVDSHKKEGLLIVPDEKKDHLIGIVTSVWENILYIGHSDYVYFNRYAGNNITYDGQEYRSLLETEVLGISSMLR